VRICRYPRSTYGAMAAQAVVHGMTDVSIVAVSFAAEMDIRVLWGGGCGMWRREYIEDSVSHDMVRRR
jgi:hypothetical protein